MISVILSIDTSHESTRPTVGYLLKIQQIHNTRTIPFQQLKNKKDKKKNIIKIKKSYISRRISG